MSANEYGLARTLLDSVPALRRLCDLDLVVFFARHSRTLMASEQLARLLGYQLKEIAQSLDGLIAAGFLTRTQNPTHPARMYVFAITGTTGGSLPAVVELASTREGRLALRRVLTQSPVGRTGGLAAQPENDLGTAVG